VRSRWIQLREHRCWNAFTSELEGSPEASAARANNDRIYINLARLYSKSATHFSSLIERQRDDNLGAEDKED
jgi:hypothetical protein